MYFRGTDGVSIFSTTDGTRIELSSTLPAANERVQAQLIAGDDRDTVGSQTWTGTLTEYTGIYVCCHHALAQSEHRI